MHLLPLPHPTLTLSYDQPLSSASAFQVPRLRPSTEIIYDRHTLLTFFMFFMRLGLTDNLFSLSLRCSAPFILLCIVVGDSPFFSCRAQYFGDHDVPSCINGAFLVNGSCSYSVVDERDAALDCLELHDQRLLHYKEGLRNVQYVINR